MNKYARFYFDITQNKDIKNTLYDTLTKKEKKNFIRYESIHDIKPYDGEYVKLDKFGMKLIEFISVIFFPFIVFIISLLILCGINIIDHLISHKGFDQNNIIASIGANPVYFIFGIITGIIILIIMLVNACNLCAIIEYYCIKYFNKDFECYKWDDLNYIFDFVILLNSVNEKEQSMDKNYAYSNDEIRYIINYRLRRRYFRLKLLKSSNLFKAVEEHERYLIDKFNTLYIDKEATHLMYGYELMKNVQLLNQNESTKDLNQIFYEIDDNYIEVDKLLDQHPNTKDNDHLIALIESIKLNKAEIKSFEKLVKLIRNKIEFEYYSQKINLLDDEREKMEKAEKRLNDIYQTIYKLDNEQVNAYDLRIKELEEKVNSLQNQVS